MIARKYPRKVLMSLIESDVAPTPFIPGAASGLPSASPALDSSRSPWWQGAAIYQIYPRSFQDSNGDGVGDLPGIARRLHHVARLGVDAIWISPFFTSPMRDFGYDVADYCGIDPVFGTMADFDALVAPGSSSTRSMPIPRTSISGSQKAARTAVIPGRTGTSGTIPAKTAPRPATGNRCSAARPGPGMAAAANITCILS